jgi:hypothetical protein
MFREQETKDHKNFDADMDAWNNRADIGATGEF